MNGAMMTIKDGTTVQVWNGNIDYAIKMLKKRMATARIFGQLGLRKHYPTTAARRRHKRAEAISRARAERRRKSNGA